LILVMSLPSGYHFRPGTTGDLGTITRLYLASFAHDRLVDMMFPQRREHPRAVEAFLLRHFQRRWWTSGWRLTVVVDETLGAPVGFTWWLKPRGEMSLWERWLSPCESCCAPGYACHG
jgi:hypothetical protein